MTVDGEYKTSLVDFSCLFKNAFDSELMWCLWGVLVGFYFFIIIFYYYYYYYYFFFFFFFIIMFLLLFFFFLFNVQNCFRLTQPDKS